MKKKIHPEYNDCIATCSCGKSIKIKSTINKNFSLDVCYSCHSFYTGRQKDITSGGRIDKFNKKFNISPFIKKK
ncbi:50S ribosomal protein L31 [Candidatus Riesia sp. GBBU]|nr:50S ribosomal protein L31 [Candidatus Riesia sp. GBBU]